MNTHFKFTLGALLSLATLAGCGRPSVECKVTVPNCQYLLTEEPAGAIDVMDVRDQAQDGQAVVVLGRIGGGAKPWIDGRAAFLLVDERVLPSCNDEQCGPDCAQCARELAEATTMVKIVDPQGKVLAVDARELLGLKEKQSVVIRGVASRDQNGNVSVAADGIYVRR